MDLKYISSSTLTGSFFILFNAPTFCEKDFFTWSTCIAHVSLLSMTHPKHVVWFTISVKSTKIRHVYNFDWSYFVIKKETQGARKFSIWFSSTRLFRNVLFDATIRSSRDDVSRTKTICHCSNQMFLLQQNSKKRLIPWKLNNATKRMITAKHYG